MKTNYVVTGLVYGRLWDGTEGSYKSRFIGADTRKEALSLAFKALEDRSLDLGMGFERLFGARLEILKITEVLIRGKWYYRKDYTVKFIGNLTLKQKRFLTEQSQD